MIITRKRICLLLVSILVVFALFFGSKYSLAQINTMKVPATPTVPGPQTAVTLDQRFAEKVLATVPETYSEVDSKNVKVLPDGKTFGYLARKGSNYAVIYNGKEVTELDPDLPIQYENSEGGVMFHGKRNGKCVFVLNDMAHDAPCKEHMAGHGVSQNGEHLAIVETGVCGRKQDDLVYIDGKKYGPFDATFCSRHVVVGNDGSFAVAARRGQKALLITGANTGTLYKKVSDPIFEPDGKTLAYLAESEQGNKLLLFVGDTLKREYDGYSLYWRYDRYFTLSSDNLSIAFIAKRSDARNQQCCVMVDDRCGETFDDVLTKPRFLDDTHEVVYQAKSGSQVFTVVGERKFEGEYTLVSAKGKTLAMIRRNESQMLFGSDGKVTVMDTGHVIVNGVERKVEGMVTELALSPDGESLAYVVEYRERDANYRRLYGVGAVVVHGDKIGERFPLVVENSLTFSPNGKALAYVVNLGAYDLHFGRWKSGKYIVVVNGKKSEAFDSVPSRLIFSPDGSKLAFGALRNREILWKVMATTSAIAPITKTSPAQKQGSSRPGSAPAR